MHPRSFYVLKMESIIAVRVSTINLYRNVTYLGLLWLNVNKMKTRKITIIIVINKDGAGAHPTKIIW